MIQNITFNSKIKPVRCAEFHKELRTINSNAIANYPWTIKESVRARDVATEGIFDCSVLGVTNGKTALLMHLCPTNLQNSNFDNIKTFIENNVKKMGTNLEAIVFGSKNFYQSSIDLSNNLILLMKKLKIPCSYLKNAMDYFDVLYKTNTDEWLISSYKLQHFLENQNNTSENALKTFFEKVYISEKDMIL